MTCLKAKTFEDNWCPFHGHFSTFAQTKIPTKMDSKNPNSRAFEGLCSKYSQFQKYLKQYTDGHSAEENKTKCLVLREVEPAHRFENNHKKRLCFQESFFKMVPMAGVEPARGANHTRF